MLKAQIGDYLPNNDSCTYSRIINITEDGFGDNLYHLDNGLQLSTWDFDINEIRLESEIFG